MFLAISFPVMIVTLAYHHCGLPTLRYILMLIYDKQFIISMLVDHYCESLIYEFSLCYG